MVCLLYYGYGSFLCMVNLSRILTVNINDQWLRVDYVYAIAINLVQDRIRGTQTRKIMLAEK